MANTTGYMGFKHIGYLPGYAPDYQTQTRTVGSGNATAIYRGDPVVYSSGVAIAATNGTGQVDAIADGCTYVNTSGQTVWSPYVPASTTATLYVISAPGALFLAQSNGTAVSVSNVNKNAGFVTGTGQTTGGGFSLYQLDAGNIATTSTYPFRIVNLFSAMAPSSVNGTDNSSNNNMAVVTFNSQDFRAGQTGV